MSNTMLFESFADLARSLPHWGRNPQMEADRDGRQGIVPRFQGKELELEQMLKFQNRIIAQQWYLEVGPLEELARRVVSELEAERRDLKLVSLDEMKQRMVTARRAQLIAG